jgi:hypothetical protein
LKSANSTLAPAEGVILFRVNPESLVGAPTQWPRKRAELGKCGSPTVPNPARTDRGRSLRRTACRAAAWVAGFARWSGAGCDDRNIAVVGRRHRRVRGTNGDRVSKSQYALARVHCCPASADALVDLRSDIAVDVKVAVTLANTATCHRTQEVRGPPPRRAAEIR